MRSLSKILFFCFLFLLIFTGCQNRPTQEIEDAKDAVKAATKESANIYAKEEIKKLNIDLIAALDEVKKQDRKLLKKNYRKANEMLSKVKADAETLKDVTIPKQREEAKKKSRAPKRQGRK